MYYEERRQRLQARAEFLQKEISPIFWERAARQNELRGKQQALLPGIGKRDFQTFDNLGNGNDRFTGVYRFVCSNPFVDFLLCGKNGAVFSSSEEVADFRKSRTRMFASEPHSNCARIGARFRAGRGF